VEIPRVLVSIPVYSSVQPEPLLSFINLVHEGTKAEMTGKYALRFHVGGPHKKTPLVRNEAAEIMLHLGTTHLLFIDDDMVFKPDVVGRLLDRNMDLISPILFTVAPTIKPIAYNRDEKGFPVSMKGYPIDSLFESPGGLGTGMLMIKRQVIEAMGPDRPIFRWICGEDIDFCKRAQELGFKCWIDSSIKVKQMSLPQPLGEEEYLMIQNGE
jgi:hypothetical protein